MEVFRITKEKFSHNLYASGFGSRWNSEGNFVIYSASSRSLAALENIVHLGTLDIINYFRVMVIYIPDNLPILRINEINLPEEWYLKGEKGYEICRQIGDVWYKNKETAILQVPSVIVKNEFNFIINTKHPDYKKVKLINTESFFFDYRIKKSNLI
ncbi:MAG: RES family NAD+ phosphorylase [Chlorobi bacterium]|nr:RES family NAD+ phosphorylase [Chlorobiota bacterium]